MAYSPEYELKNFGRWRTERLLEIGDIGDPDLIHGTLLLAIGSRETNLRNIVGGGYFEEYEEVQSDGSTATKKRFVVTGIDRGVFQINAQFHPRWLDSVKGCDSGTYEEKYNSALPPGRVPGLTSGAKKARDILRYNITYARSKNVPEDSVVRVAIAAYNCGNYLAVRAYEEGDPDKYTSLGNYSKDVLERQRAIRRWIQNRGWGHRVEQ